MAKERRMTIKQKKFADEYIITGNAYQSAIEAGYSESYAKGNVIKLLENVSVKSYIEERMQELEDQAIAKQDEVLKYLTSIMRGEESEETLIGEGMGEQRITTIDVSAKDRLKAAELIGKRYGMWTEKLETTVEGAVVFIDDIIDTSEED